MFVGSARTYENECIELLGRVSPLRRGSSEGFKTATLTRPQQTTPALSFEWLLTQTEDAVRCSEQLSKLDFSTSPLQYFLKCLLVEFSFPLSLRPHARNLTRSPIPRCLRCAHFPLKDLSRTLQYHFVRIPVWRGPSTEVRSMDLAPAHQRNPSPYKMCCTSWDPV